MDEHDIHIYSHDAVFRQVREATYRFGYYVLKFYEDPFGRPSKEKTDCIAEFYLFPSGGCLRDSNMNIILYDSKYDTYRGFTHPHLEEQNKS